MKFQIPWGPDSSPTSIDYNPVDVSKFAENREVTLASVISSLGEVALYVGAFLMFFWAAWGVFDYIRAEGNKEALAKARKRIQWAIVGFIILLLAFFLSNTVQTILKPDTSRLQEIKAP